MIQAHSAEFAAALEEFSRGRGSRDQNRQVVSHLLHGCPRCAERTGRIWPALEAEPPRKGAQCYDYTGSFERAQETLDAEQIALAEESAQASRLRAGLERHPPDRQKLLVRNSRQFRTWSLVLSLLEDCEAARRTDLAAAILLGELAVVAVDRLSRPKYGEQRVEDLRARARIELAAAHRCQNRFREAELLLEEASDLLAEGTGDPVERANLCFYQASLWIDRRQFERATRLLQRTVALSRRVGEKTLWCKALLNQARCEIERGRPEEALSISLQAQQLLDLSIDPRLAVVLQHNVLYALVRCDRFEEAAAGLEDTRALHGRFDHPVDRLRMDWLEGQIYVGLGRQNEAERLFRAALDGFLSLDLHYDAAVLGLELADLLSQQGRRGDLRQLSTALLPIFQSGRLGREVIASLLIFSEAVAREQVSTDLIRSLLDSVRPNRYQVR